MKKSNAIGLARISDCAIAGALSKIPKKQVAITMYIPKKSTTKLIRNSLLNFVSAYDRLLVTIRRENIAFENKIDIFTMLKSYHVRLGMTNDRILAQAGSFIIAGLDDVYINESLMSSRTKEFHARIILTKSPRQKNWHRKV